MNPEQKDGAEGTEPSTAAEVRPDRIENSSETPGVGRKKTWKKVVAIVIAIIIAAPLLGLVFIWISFSGGIDGVANNAKPAPDPNDSGITAQRDAAKRSIDESFKALDANMSITNYATSTHDRCYEGQNNWKVQDGYAHRCAYRVTQFYGFNSDFRQKMVDLDLRLATKGWNATGMTMARMLTEYYDHYYGPDKPKPLHASQYLVSSLPKPTYYQGEAYTDTDVLELEFAEKDTNSLFSIEYIQNISSSGSGTYEKQEFQDIQSVFDKIITDNTYVLVISIEKQYFQN